jgi:hypothetical protein
MAKACHLAQLFRGSRPEDNGGHDRLQDRRIISVGGPVGLLQKHLFFAQQPLKFFNQGLTDHSFSFPGWKLAPLAQYVVGKEKCQLVLPL